MKWKEELKNSKESLVELVVNNPVQYAGDILEAIEEKWENEVLIIGNYNFYEEFKNKATPLFDVDSRKWNGVRAFKKGDKWHQLNFHKKYDDSIRGKRYDVIIILDEETLNTVTKTDWYRGRAIMGQVILINKTKHRIIRIEEESENNNDNKTLLQEEISRLYKELSQIDHNEKTTMTRERLIKMIESLEGINKKHYSYVNDYGNSVSCGVGDGKSESKLRIEEDGISCEVRGIGINPPTKAKRPGYRFNK